MIREVTMYRAECDHEGCAASPQDAGDFYAWKEPDAALWDADDCDWYKTDGVLLCDEHAPRCAVEDCNLQLFSDEFGALCEDHASAEPPRNPSSGEVAS